MPEENNQNNNEGLNEPKIDLSNPAFEKKAEEFTNQNPPSDLPSSTQSFPNAGDGLSQGSNETVSNTPPKPESNFQSSFSNEMMYEEEKSMPDIKKILIIMGAILLLGSLIIGGYIFISGRKSASKDQVEDLVEEEEKTEEEAETDKPQDSGDDSETPVSNDTQTETPKTEPASQPNIEVPQPEVETPDETGAVNGTG